MDLYLLVWFRFEKWYLDGLTKQGLTSTQNWKQFVKNKIGDIEKWILENKPKN